LRDRGERVLSGLDIGWCFARTSWLCLKPVAFGSAKLAFYRNRSRSARISSTGDIDLECRPRHWRPEICAVGLGFLRSKSAFQWRRGLLDMEKLLFFLGLALLLSSCSQSGRVTYKVDGTEFSVPQDHIIGRSAWFPNRASGSFMFILNPERQEKYQINIGVDPKSRACRSIPNSGMKRDACSGRIISTIGATTTKKRAYGSSWWGYVMLQDGGEGVEIASCSPAGEVDGLCMSVTFFEDAIVTYYYAESINLDPISIRNKVVETLALWNAQAAQI